MRCWFILLLSTLAASADSVPRIQLSHTKEGLRGVSAVSRQVAWASGMHGTYLRTTDAGLTWTPAHVPAAEALDFRAVVAFSADEAFLMSAGPGDRSRVYYTSDGGQRWQLQFTNANPKGFFDSMVFWDPKHGLVLGDPVPDGSGALKFELLETDDGQSWHEVASERLPPALEGEGAFAASNTCIAILAAHVPKEAPDGNIWFATGGKSARVFHSPDRGRNWEVFTTPMVHGADSTGIFSIAFRDPLHGIIAGGDFKHPNDDGPNLAFTDDGGKTWTLSPIRPQAYFSAAAYDQRVNVVALQQENAATEGKKSNWGLAAIPAERIFLVGQDFVFDFRPPNNPRGIGAGGKVRVQFNAISTFPEGGALVVGPKGTIAEIP